MEARALDYEIRVQLPVKIGSFAEDVRLRQVGSERATVHQQLSNTPDIVEQRFKIPFGGDVPPLRFPNPEKARLQQRFDGLTASLQTLSDAYPQALGTAMYKQWIETPSTQRCLDNAVSEYCLSNAQLSEYRKKAIASVQ